MRRIPGRTRLELARNGFRVGVIGNQVPPARAKVLELAGQLKTCDAVQEWRAADMEGTSHPSGRHLQMRAGGRNEILASAVYEQMPLLVREGGELRGRDLLAGPGPPGCQGLSAERRPRPRGIGPRAAPRPAATPPRRRPGDDAAGDGAAPAGVRRPDHFRRALARHDVDSHRLCPIVPGAWATTSSPRARTII